MTGTPKMHTTPSPYFAVPWRTGSSSTTYWPDSEDHLQVCFCSPRHKIPRDACTMDANWQQRGTEGDQGQSFCLPQPYPPGNDTWCQYPCAPWRIGRDCDQAGRGPPRSHRMHQDPDGLLQDEQWWASQAWTMLQHIIHAYCHEGKLLGKLMAKPFKTPSNKLADIAVNHFTIQHAREQVSHSSKPMDTICQDKGQTAHTSHSSHGHTPSAPSKDCPNCTQQHPAGRANCPSCDFPLFQMQQNGTLGTQMPWWQATPTKECTPPPGSQQRKSRCPLRNHNHCQGQKNKTDTIDVREDHSPQDKIALHYIQPNTTVRHTHPEEIMVRDVHAPQCNEAYTTIHLPASAQQKGNSLTPH